MLHFKSPHTVLVVDDDSGPRESLKMILQKRYKVLTCDDPQKAIDIISSGDIDVVMLDIKMPKISGLKLLKAVKSTGIDTEILLITGYPSMESAIEAMKYGAYDYVIKPFDKERVEHAVQKGVIQRTQKKLEKNLASNLITEIYKKYSDKQKPVE